MAHVTLSDMANNDNYNSTILKSLHILSYPSSYSRPQVFKKIKTICIIAEYIVNYLDVSPSILRFCVYVGANGESSVILLKHILKSPSEDTMLKILITHDRIAVKVNDNLTFGSSNLKGIEEYIKLNDYRYFNM